MCPTCYKEYVRIETIQPNKDDLIRQYSDIIDICIRDNEKYKKEIAENEALIIHYSYLLQELKNK